MTRGYARWTPWSGKRETGAALGSWKVEAGRRTLCVALAVVSCLPACGGGEERSVTCASGFGVFERIAPTLSPIHLGAELTWEAAEPSGEVEVGTASDAAAAEPDSWMTGGLLVLDQAGTVKVFARVVGDGCVAEERFEFVYDVRAGYPGPAGSADSTAVALDDPRLVRWASSVVEPVEYGAEVSADWRHPEQAVGPASGNPADVVSLGQGGSIVLELDPPVSDGSGPDFAVFENGVNDTFLELAFVEVSSDGEYFVRFDSAYLGDKEVGAYAGHDTTLIGGLAGKYRGGFGTPFDLAWLEPYPDVQSGKVDLSSIRFVRLVDVVGDGSRQDSFGHPVYAPFPTKESAGFDLDGIGALSGSP
ncbi:MAG: hypothetical protein FJ109_21675 [Deltaproteobacteria bacterium]|nr:hypothetical protein [Deltaproteobacteria bacterium]